MICSKCKKNAVGTIRKIFFIHNNLEFTISKWPYYCAECAQKECIERFDDFNDRYNLVLKEGNKIKVDWKLYAEVLETEILDKMSNILMDLGTLSLIEEENWDVVAPGYIGLNPWFMGQIYLYFVRKEDAIEFARLKYSNTIYGWLIKKRAKDGHYVIFAEKEIVDNSVIG